ncbi:Mucin-associated surface protein (MASP) subgroup S025 [Trypanosoma cruzi]|uniref:Mucin-associated surface protein (MASP) subgroup S025 n=1 Tax=Trypanosoma cruzi TaxID=5693 RepID=A0A7J6XXV2_TRYCR|nr:Mucin-associated surface protein (MASP) subgroup S025 [Trypanosoma cruzi]
MNYLHSFREHCRFQLSHVLWASCCHHLLLCGDCVWCSGLVFLHLLSLSVDGVLVCVEGYTQVTGVMAMMMTGRVLLVCALCVLWCGTSGGRCDEEKETTPANLSGAPSSGESPPTESKTLSPASGSPSLISKPKEDEKSKHLPAKESSEAKEGSSSEGNVVNGDEALQEEPSGHLSESEEEEGLPKEQKEEKKTHVIQDGEQNRNQPTSHEPSPHQPPSAESHAGSTSASVGGVKDSLDSPLPGVISSPHGDGDRGTTGSTLSNPQSTSPKEVLSTEETGAQRHSLSNEKAAKGDIVGSIATPGSEGPSFLEEQKTKDLESETHQTAGSSEDLNTESQGSAKAQLELVNVIKPEPQTSHGIKTPETEGNDSHNTDISKNLPDAQETEHVQEKNNENPASSPVKAQRTSTATHEEAPASHPNGIPSPLQKETFTGMKTTEDVQPPEAAATNKPQTGDKSKDVNSDGSTAASHTTSPLLLLLAACAAAAALEAA